MLSLSFSFFLAFFLSSLYSPLCSLSSIFSSLCLIFSPPLCVCANAIPLFSLRLPWIYFLYENGFVLWIHLQTAESASCALLQRGCKCVIVTLGAQGAWVQNSSGLATHVPARKVDAVDSSGAGDAFIGALAYFLSCVPRLSLMEMVRRACEISTLTVLHEGTQSSFPDAKDLPLELLSSD